MILNTGYLLVYKLAGTCSVEGSSPEVSEVSKTSFWPNPDPKQKEILIQMKHLKSL